VTLEPYYEEPGITIYCADCRDVLPTLEASSFDACLCDPPYGLKFMGKDWDHGVPGPAVWAKVFRVLKPGAFLLAFGGTRTHHRLMCAIEDAGFEIRDCMMWLYGQGFPKSLDIGKAIDKAAGALRETLSTRSKRGAFGGVAYAQDSWTLAQSNQPLALPITAPATDAGKLFDGYGTALKPAYEPIIVAMKPCEGTFAENALRHGVAGINIEAGRIPAHGDKLQGGGSTVGKFIENHHEGWQRPWMADDDARESMRARSAEAQAHAESAGRWPSNVILDEEAGAQLDRMSGESKSTGGSGPASKQWRGDGHTVGAQLAGATGGFGDSGGASRFFYCAKASKSERGEGNNHPTVKPLKLIEYLARLILPPQGGKLLVPFSGSGSEMLGARNSGWTDVTGIELSAGYADIAIERLRQEVLPLEAEAPQPEQMAL
jgi:site-specific DNA-methyltransferase (adenine-specific)